MATVSFGTFAKRRNSTKQPQSLSDQRTVTLKESCSQDAPVFICTGDDFDFNYCMWNNKYYFITDVISLKNNLIEIHCIMDALATYKSEILSSTQFVSYSSALGSSWLPDTRIPVLRNCKVSSNSANTGILSTTGCYILSTIGKDSCNTYMITNEGELKILLSNIQTWQNNAINAADALINTWRGTDLDSFTYYADAESLVEFCKGLVQTLQSGFQALTGTLANIQKALADSIVTIGKAATDTGFIGNAYLSAPECLRSCIWVPFNYNLAPIGGVDRIYLGVWDTGRTGSNLKAIPVTDNVSINIPWHYSDWRRGYCEEVYIYLPFVGVIALSSDSITNASSITIEWSATYTDGVIMYKVSAGGQVIGAYGGQCSSNYPIGMAQQSSAGEIVQSAWASAEKVVASALKTSSSENLTAFIGGAVEGKMATISGAYNVVDTALTKHVSSVGGIGGGAGVGLGTNIICYTVAHDLNMNPSDMIANMGQPTMKPMSLSTLTGYCQCANAHVEVAATAEEMNAIDTFLNSGFFIE